MRKLVGVLLGATIGLAAIYGLWRLNTAMFAWRPADFSDPASLSAMIDAAPLTAKAMMAGGWFMGALVGGLVGVRAAAWATAGWIVAVLIALAGVYQIVEVPHPLWMQVAAVVTPFLAGFVVSGASGAA
jgi:hypothetical protein